MMTYSKSTKRSAEKAEISAFRARYGELQKTYTQKGCDNVVTSDDSNSSVPVNTMTTKERLVELKELFDEDLITEMEYEKARAAVLSGQ